MRPSLVRKKEFVLGFAFGFALALTSIHQSHVIFDTQHPNDDLDFVEADADQQIEFAEATQRADRIFCWVVTSPRNKIKAKVVKETWGKRCDKLLFMSSAKDLSLPAVGLPIGEESRNQLWRKAKMTFKFIYSHYLNDFDWFFKADDDTFVVMENLRRFLAPFNSSEPLFLGHEFGRGNTSFLSGGAGYVLSRETMRRLVDIGLKKRRCPENYKGEEDDVSLTQCLGRIGAIIPKTSDRLGRHRFLSCNVEQFYQGQVGPVKCNPRDKSELNCLSTDPITFHYVSGLKMLEYEFLLYGARIGRNVKSE